MVDPEGKRIVDLTFASEVLGMPAADGNVWASSATSLSVNTIGTY